MGKDTVVFFHLAQNIGIFLVDDKFRMIRARTRGFGIRHIKADTAFRGKFSHLAKFIGLNPTFDQNSRQQQIQTGIQCGINGPHGFFP